MVADFNQRIDEVDLGGSVAVMTPEPAGAAAIPAGPGSSSSRRSRKPLPQPLRRGTIDGETIRGHVCSPTLFCVFSDDVSLTKGFLLYLRLIAYLASVL